jgi:hypothetical protein
MRLLLCLLAFGACEAAAIPGEGRLAAAAEQDEAVRDRTERLREAPRPIPRRPARRAFPKPWARRAAHPAGADALEAPRLRAPPA